MSYAVGLTGGIGSGKSTVAAMFAGLGVAIVDTDAISHQLTQANGAAIPALRAEFGADCLTPAGALDRAKMRQRVFGDSNARQRLEAILHPLILQQAKAQALSATAPYVMVVVPLLFESGHYRDWLQRTLLVDCAEHAQIARAAGREGINEKIVRAIMQNQCSRQQRLALADDMIDNNGNLAGLLGQVNSLHSKYLQLAAYSN